MAAEIIKIVTSDNRNDKLDDFLCLDAIEHDEFIIKLLNENIEKIVKPQKNTLLHAFIREFYDMYIYNVFYDFEEFIIENGEFEDLYSLLEEVGDYFKDCGWDVADWEEKISVLVEKIDLEYDKEECNIKPLEKEVSQLIDDMRNTSLGLRDDVAENVFFLLFSNKKFLFNFNLMIAKYIKPFNLTNDVFNEFNHIIRCTNIPKWLENGILYRDRATCQQWWCRLIQFFSDHGKWTDHIIPLEKGGTNDSTNFQLLCSRCNLTKNDNLQLPNYQYQMYWK